MRVITPFGFGEVEKLPESGSITVDLEQSFLGKSSMWLDRISQVFPFTDFAVVRVLNITGSGWFSNLQFQRESQPYPSVFTPPDETTFLLHVLTGHFSVDRELGILAQKFLWIQPWVDRWSVERSTPLDDGDVARAVFDVERKRTVGSLGIQASILLDMRAQKISRFCLMIAPPQGVVYEKAW